MPVTLKTRNAKMTPAQATLATASLLMGKTLDLDPNTVDIGTNSREDQREITAERVKEMAGKLRRNGQLQEIEVRPNPEKPGRFIINFGFTRLAAATALRNGDDKLGIKGDNKFTIRARVTDKPSKGDRPPELQGFIHSIAENRDRNGTTPLDQAHQMQVLRDEFGVTDNAEIAQYLGCNPSWLVTLDKLNDLDPDMKEAVRNGQIGAKYAADTVGFTKDRVKRIIEAMANAAKATTKALREAGKPVEEVQQAATTASRKAGKGAVAAEVASGGKTRKSKAGRKSGASGGGLRAAQEIRATFADLVGNSKIPKTVTDFAMVMCDFISNRKGKQAVYTALAAVANVKLPVADLAEGTGNRTTTASAPARETASA